MKRTITFVVIMILIPVLVSCALTPTGNSIDDCMEMDQCSYLNNDVRLEESDMANDLRELLLNNQDDMIFSYTIDRGGDMLDVTYHTHEDFTADKLDDLMPLLDQIKTVVDTHYDIDYINCILIFEGCINITSRYSLDSANDYIEVEFDYESSKEDPEDYILNKLDEYADDVIIFINSNYINKIQWYGGYSNGISLELRENYIYVATRGNANTTNIDARVTNLLDRYTLEFSD